MREAIEAIKAGDRARAFALLRRHLAANPRDANGWLWMAEAAPEATQQRDALQRVLRLEPDHPRAAAVRQRLAALDAQLQPAAPPEMGLPAEAEVAVPDITPAMVDDFGASPPADAVLAEPVAVAASPDMPASEPATEASSLRVYPAPAEAPSQADEPLSALGDSPAGAEAMVDAGIVERETRPIFAPIPDPEEPRRGERIPAWVWLIMLLSLVLVGVLLSGLYQVVNQP